MRDGFAAILSKCTDSLLRQQPLPSFEMWMPWPRGRLVNALLVNWLASVR
jgi:hypothetical protein